MSYFVHLRSSQHVHLGVVHVQEESIKAKEPIEN